MGWRDHWRDQEKLRFVLVGGWNTLFGYLCFLTLYVLLHDRVHYLVVGTMAHALTVVNAFVAQRWLVFRSRRKWFKEFLRFNVAQLSVLGCGLGTLWLLVSVAHLSPPLGQAVVTVGTVIVSYYVHRYFTFAARRSP